LWKALFCRHLKCTVLLTLLWPGMPSMRNLITCQSMTVT
jgi:hypothetical protein